MFLPSTLGAISLDLFAVLLGGATALLPIYAHDILATGPPRQTVDRSMFIVKLTKVEYPGLKACS